MANELDEKTSTPTRHSSGAGTQRIDRALGSDLREPRKNRLRDFLSRQTLGADDNSTANEFPIPNGTTIPITNGPQDDGTPTPLAQTPTVLVEGDSQTFFSFENEARAIFNAVSSGAFFDSYESSAGAQIETIAANFDIPDAAGLKNNQKFGHRAGTEKYVETVSEQVSAVLRNNRFSPPLVPNQTQELFNERNQDTIGNQQYFGKQVNQETRQRFAKLGVEASIAASGFIGNDPVDAEGTSLSGIWAQTFDTFNVSDIANINSGDLGLENGVDDRLRDGTRRISERAYIPTREWLDREDNDNIDLTYIDSEGRVSENGAAGDEENHAYTVMNSMISKFIQEELFTNRQYINGLTFMAAVFVQNILLAVIFDALLAFEFAAKKGQFQNLRDQYENNPTQLARGKARGNSVPLGDLLGSGENQAGEIMELFGIPDLQELLSGPLFVEFILNFMGVNKPIQAKTNLQVAGFKLGDVISFVPSYLIGTLQTTISALKDPMSAGFFFNLGRQIARKAALQNAPSAEGNEFEFIRYFMDLRQASGFRFFVTMVNLGDNAIGQFYAKSANSGGLDILNETKVTWGSSMISPASVMANASAFLIPKSFRNFSKQVQQGLVNENDELLSGVSNDGTDMQDQFINPDNFDNKIDPLLVAELESKLDKEYMPFYIKDMRTNEIISFHAFLNTLSDGFSATYSGVTGLGRIEPAHIYESSNRTIGVSFTMIAFSKQDLDMLYWKLNKLVTLLYPQFSKGTQLTGPDDRKFYMPFSQIPTSSPMVRLRIGDILTNNFSEAAAARLMGIGFEEIPSIINTAPPGAGDAYKVINPNKSEFVNGLTPTVVPLIGPTLLSNQTNRNYLQVDDIVRISLDTTKSRTGKVVVPSALVLPASIKPTLGVGVPNTVQINSDVTKSINLGDKRDIYYTPDLFKIIGFEAIEETSGRGKRKVKTPNYDKIKVWLVTERIGGNPSRTEALSPERAQTENNFLALSKNQPGGVCFWVYLSQIKGVEQSLSTEGIKFIQENTIIKSFENSRGEGMAGFIDNLQIDWQLNTYMWETEPGRRAPTGCNITLGFKPIHDITPGIDADGFNRAPVYKVGDLSRNIHAPGNLAREAEE